MQSHESDTHHSSRSNVSRPRNKWDETKTEKNDLTHGHR